MSAIRLPILILVTLFVLGSLLIWPRIDLIVSGWFYGGGNFSLARNGFFLFMRDLAYYGARVLGLLLALLALTALFRRKVVAGIDAKGWAFLFLALLLGPGLIANVGFKDHWGRARPREITEFGGTGNFSPAMIPQETATLNGSFISGDAAFGFYLPCFAYVVPRRRNFSRRVFWGGMSAGALFGFCRLAMGAHFLSDILFATAFMLAMGAFLHLLMFGRRATAICWHDWLFERP